MRWTTAWPQGRARRPCEGHTVSVVGKCLYILFGKHEDDLGNLICPPLQMFDTESMSLSHPCPCEGPDRRTHIPDEREGHTASVVGTKIYVFGGTWNDDDENNAVYLNDLHILETSSFCWTHPSTEGAPPVEREGHTACVVRGSRILYFGGTWVDEEDNSIYLNDLHELDAETHTWSQPEVGGKPPLQREGHTACVVGESMVVFGGAGLDPDKGESVNLADVHALDLPTMRWAQVDVGAGDVPQARAATRFRRDRGEIETRLEIARRRDAPRGRADRRVVCAGAPVPLGECDRLEGLRLRWSVLRCRRRPTLRVRERAVGV